MARRYYKKRYSKRRELQVGIVGLFFEEILVKAFARIFNWIISLFFKEKSFEVKEKKYDIDESRNKRRFVKKYIEKEKAEDYSNREIQTKRGEIVKSYGEQQISDYLYWLGVDYEYEHEYKRKDGGISKPDFYLPEYDVYIEYFGMMKYSPKYRFEMHLKFETFEKEGMKVIKIYEKHIQHKNFKKALNLEFKELTGMDLPHPQIDLSPSQLN